MKAKISKASVDDLRAKAVAAGKTLYVWDREMAGFGVLSTAKGSASYFIEYRLGGRGTPNKRLRTLKFLPAGYYPVPVSNTSIRPACLGMSRSMPFDFPAARRASSS